MQVFQPSKNPISAWRSRVALSGCHTGADRHASAALPIDESDVDRIAGLPSWNN